jgi:hypothetical protein
LKFSWIVSGANSYTVLYDSAWPLLQITKRSIYRKPRCSIQKKKDMKTAAKTGPCSLFHFLLLRFRSAGNFSRWNNTKESFHSISTTSTARGKFHCLTGGCTFWSRTLVAGGAGCVVSRKWDIYMRMRCFFPSHEVRIQLLDVLPIRAADLCRPYRWLIINKTVRSILQHVASICWRRFGTVDEYTPTGAQENYKLSSHDKKNHL